ncbi:uncharacterized protein LOC144671985 [Cetorhinus maximus]
MVTVLQIENIYYPVLAAFGVPANLMTIAILSRGNCDLSKCISLYMAAMAAADLLVMIFNILESALLSWVCEVLVFRSEQWRTRCQIQKHPERSPQMLQAVTPIHFQGTLDPPCSPEESEDLVVTPVTSPLLTQPLPMEVVMTCSLFNNNLTDSCAEDLASVISTNQSLTDLDLGVNPLGDSGVKLLSVGLRNSGCKIQRLGLGGNKLTDSCAEDLASVFNRSLTDLNLGDNNLGDSGVKRLSVALRGPDCKIQKLDLWGNRLTDSCAEDLASALSTNRSLTDLNLGANSFTDQSVPALRRLILTCRTLSLIQLRDNRFSPNGENQLKSLQGTRSGLSVTM